MDFAGAQVTDVAGPQRDEAAVADAHAAAAGHQDAGVLADIEQRRVAVGLDFTVGGLEGDQAAVVPGTAGEAGAEAFDGQGARAGRGLLGVLRFGLPQRLGVVEEPFRAACVGGALAPVRAEPVQVGGGGEVQPSALAGEPVRDAQVGELVGELGEFFTEDGVRGGAGGVDQDDVGVAGGAARACGSSTSPG